MSHWQERLAQLLEAGSAVAIQWGRCDAFRRPFGSFLKDAAASLQETPCQDGMILCSSADATVEECMAFAHYEELWEQMEQIRFLLYSLLYSLQVMPCHVMP